MVGSNFCDVTVVSDPRTSRAVCVSALDNLGKGGSANGLQSLNIMMGWDERTGLAPGGVLGGDDALVGGLVGERRAEDEVAELARTLEGMLAAYKLRAVPINVNFRYVDDEVRYPSPYGASTHAKVAASEVLEILERHFVPLGIF